MAQALFEEHPLEQYLRESGEASELMPGGSVEFVLANDGGNGMDQILNGRVSELEWIPVYITRALKVLWPVSHHTSASPSPFVERFKYDVISSSLLSTSLPAPPSNRRDRSPAIPGRLSLVHSRPPSVDYTQALQNLSGSTCLNQQPVHVTSESQYWLIIMTGVFLFSAGFALPILVLGLALYCTLVWQAEPLSRPEMTSSLEALNDLIAAGKVWDSVVHETIAALEDEEHNVFYGPTTPSSPSSSIRVALHSSLLTTQTQCDNVRQIFSALTSPAELSQLSEMYAPPSPVKFSFTDRPLSLPGSSRKRTSSVPTEPSNKRATWNGSYLSLASAGSPTMQVLKRREKRRSDLSSLLDASSLSQSSSAPVTPSVSAPTLSGVQEEGNSLEEVELPSEPFGIDALDLHRKQRAAGMETLGMQPPSYSSINHSPRKQGSSAPSTIASSSRFTTMQTSRHPLSLSALHHALQGALASKRYACSHLLALRFSEEEDEGYWEDVRSVMGLLTSTFVDASSRLTEALEDVERQKLSDQTPTPESLPPSSRASSISPPPGDSRKSKRMTETMDQIISFAPVASHLSRFAAHVHAISTALNDARDNLEQCVNSLRDEPIDHVHSHKRRRSGRSPLHDTEGPEQDAKESAALQAYERLRREIGLALRECERGRERLLDIVSPPSLVDSDGDGDPEDLPALGPDGGSDDSDKPESRSDDSHIGFEVLSPPDVGDEGGVVDDATPHLLLATSSQHLPPPGIEQVYEGESGTGIMFLRERSKMTREERIQLMKERRASGTGRIGVVQGNDRVRNPGIERWGPGGEVVQELKDVIWKVGERRRKMADGQLHNVVPQT